MPKKKLLLNWVYYDPAGHVIEALKNAYGYFEPNQSRVEISVLLNAKSAIALAEACDWISTIYPISLDEVMAHGAQASCLQPIPKTWDYVVHDPRTRPEAFVPGWDEAELIAAQAVLRPLFQATEWQDDSPGFEDRWHSAGLWRADTPLPYRANAQLVYPVPQAARDWVRRYQHDGPTLCILPRSGSGIAQSPSLRVWEQICTALAASIPNLRIYITGISQPWGGEPGVDSVVEADIDRLCERNGHIVNCYDIGMWNQIALIEACDLFCSPHTGFAFISQFVGAPWLIIAGCPWIEYLFNGTPFYSALPDCKDYPAQERTDTECCRRWLAGQQVVCMEDANILKRMPDIVAGARLLLDRSLTFEQACALHVSKLKAAGRDPKRQRLWYFDWSDEVH